MFAGYQVIIYPPFLIDIELHQRKSPVFGIERITQKTQEPGRSNLSVYLIVSNTITTELYFSSQYTALPLLYNGKQVRVHQTLTVNVV